MRVPAACTLVLALALLLLSGCGVRDAALAEGDGGAYILVRMDNGADSTGAAFACGEDIYTVNMNFAEDGSSEYSLVRNGAEVVFAAGTGQISLACGGADSLWLLEGGTLRRLSFDGEQLLGLELSCEDMLCLGDELYVLSGGRVEVLDRAGEALRSFDVDDGAGIVRGGDGQAYVTLPAGDGMDVYALDAGRSSAVRLPQVTAAYPGSAECPLLCLRPEGLYWLRADGALEPAALWESCGAAVGNLRHAEALEDGRILLLDSLGPGLLEEAEQGSEPSAEAVTLRLGTVGDGLRYITDSYNTQSDGTRVQEIDYTLGGTLSVQDALIRLTADIASGEGPDMLLITNLPVQSYIRRGLLAELSGLLDTADVVMAKALEESGGLYYLTRSFGVETYAGLASNFGEAEGWTMDEYLEAESQLGSDAEMFYNATQELFLRMTGASYMREAIDWSSGECRFDSAGFIRILETAAAMTEYPEEAVLGYTPTEELLRTGAEYVTLCNISSVTKMASFEAAVGERLCFVGMPTPDGANGSVMNVNGAVGVMAYTEHPEACADFLEYLLSGYDSSELDYERNGSMPMYRPYFEELVARAKADGKLSDEDAKRLYDFLDGVRYTNVYDKTVIDIILEEASAVCGGIRGAAEAAGIIQERVSTYVAEQS